MSIFKVGDRVSQPLIFGQPDRHYGTVVKIYKSRQGVGFNPITLIDIEWDDKGLQRGHMEQFLQKEK